MDLATFISDPARKAQLALATGRSAGYLWQVATGWRGKRASVELAQSIERESSDIGPEPVPKSSLRPDVWPPEAINGDDPPSHRASAAEGESTAEPTTDALTTRAA